MTHGFPMTDEICPCCGNVQGETGPTRPGDKWAWECRNCRWIIENGKPFLLDAALGKTHYRSYGGGYCCMGRDRVRYEMRHRYITDDPRRSVCDSNRAD